MIFKESETVKLKSLYTDGIKKEIVAFANTLGGTIYIGAEDNGDISGVDNVDDVIQQVMNVAHDAIKPDVTMLMQIESIQEEGKTVLAVQVQCGAHKPYYLAEKGLRPEGVFIRQGTSSVPASDTAIRQMIKETDGDNYEDMRSLEQVLTFEKATAEFVRRNMEFGEAQMKTLGLIDPEGLYSNLALLLSDQCPHIIMAATFAGSDQDSFQDRREFTGSLFKQLEDAYAYLDFRNRTMVTFNGLLRIDHKDYPDTAIREALINTIVHRDYAVSASTLLSVYSDRMELLSIGGLVDGISYDDMMLGVSYCRNQKLANVFYRLGLIEAYGTGMKKIMSSYEGCALRPDVQVTSGAFKFVLPNQNTAKPTAEYAETVLNEREKTVLTVLADRKPHPRTEIERALGMSTSTVNRLLHKMIAAGWIVASGTTKNALYRLHSEK